MGESWDLKKIESYIVNQVEENINLDYKAADALQKTEAKKKEISKDISAMANAAGGVIIYGIKEFDHASKRHLPEQLDPVNRTNISKEWLEQVINTNIHPKVNDVIITPVSKDDTNGLVIYIVEIPQSNTAHQAADKRYYKRYNFESVPMEDYEIRDIMNRLKHPYVRLEFILERKQRTEKVPITGGPTVSILPFQDIATKNWVEYKLRIVIQNIGKIIANYINYYVELPQDILHKSEDHLVDAVNRPGYKQFYGENTLRDVVDIENLGFRTIKKYGPSRFDPVLPGTKSRSNEIQLKDDLDVSDKDIYWEIYADNAEKKTGTITMDELVQNIKCIRED